MVKPIKANAMMESMKYAGKDMKKSTSKKSTKKKPMSSKGDKC